MGGGAMDANVLQNEWLNQAFQLAYFIHGDKATAVRIVGSAMNLLEVAAAAQDKRLYYTPTGRTLARKTRTKVSLSEIHLLQRLIYIESEPFERVREQGSGQLDDKDLLIHFIKHLVKITVKRNSFYVTLGLSRLLHTYTTAETQEVYNVVVQDPERVKDDYYYRSRKAQLMREMKERFAGLLTCVKGQRGEEKFQSLEASQDDRDFVGECLSRFTPWGTPCLMPAKFDPFNDELRHLSFKEKDPDEEHQVEVNRLHTLLHPQCYARLTTGIGFDAPELKLQIPQFSFTNQDQGGPSSGRKNKMTLHDDELEGIRDTLSSQSTRRRHVAAGLFRVLVDGKECGRFDVKEGRRIRFEIAEGAELIEVRAKDDQGELLLASHLLEFDSEVSVNQPFERSIVLEAGQQVTFSVQPFRNPANETDGALIEVSYKETAKLRAAALFWQQLKHRAAQGSGVRGWLFGGAMKPLLATLFLALCAAVLFFYFQSGKNVKEVAKDPQVLPAPQAPEVPKIANDPPQNQLPESPQQPPQKQQPEKRTGIIANDSGPGNRRRNPLESIPDAGPNRGERPPSVTGVPFTEVRKIAVEPYGEETLNPQLRQALSAALQATGRFTITPSPAGADAVLKISTKQGVPEQGENSPGATIIARLVNARGYVVWPAKPNGSGQVYSGSMDELAAKLAADMMREIQKAQRQ
jgi:hypothetical protein